MILVPAVPYANTPDPYGFTAKPEVEGVLLNWNSGRIKNEETVEIATVIKKIGQGRKPFSHPQRFGRNVSSHRLSFEGLTDVFIRFRVMDAQNNPVYEKVERTEVLKENVRTLVVDGRKVYVYLPKNYSETGKPQDVLLMQDGQNLFSSGSSTGTTEWRVDETVEKLVSEGKIPPLVVIGIASTTDRIPSFWPRSFGYSEGKGEEYGAWITEKLMPQLRSTYHLTNEKWAVSGSSYGAVISLYLGFHYRELFSRIGAISPAMDLGGQDFVAAQSLGIEKIYFDAGEKEQYRIIQPQVFDFPKNAVALSQALRKQGYVYGRDLAFFEDPLQVSHKEDVVAARLENMLLFLFGKDRTAGAVQIFSSSTIPGLGNRVQVHSDGFRLTLLE